MFMLLWGGGLLQVAAALKWATTASLLAAGADSLQCAFCP
jgi:hypothetical protein